MSPDEIRKVTASDVALLTEPKFSPNIRRWVAKRVPRDAEMRAWTDVNDRAVIGYSYDGDIIGSGLGDVMAVQTRIPQCWWFGGGIVEELPGWWGRYAAEGRCWTDPKHVRHIERWTVIGPTRRCGWCGLAQREVTVSKLVTSTEWVSP